MSILSYVAAVGLSRANAGALVGFGQPSRRQALLGLALLAAVAFAGDFGYRYWTVGRFLESTNDAYVQADYTTIAPKVSGYISAVASQDNQQVKAGDVLARIDDRDYRTALAQAKADVASAEADIRNIDAQLAEQQSVIAQAKGRIVAGQAAVKFSRDGYYDLLSEADRRHASRTRSRARRPRRRPAADRELQSDRAALTAAHQRVEVLNTARVKAETQVRACSPVDQAELNLSYTTIAAPIDGTVGARSLRVGQYVQAGTQLMAVVPLHAVYVVANYKETQLTNVAAGQPVEIEVDAFPVMS